MRRRNERRIGRGAVAAIILCALGAAAARAQGGGDAIRAEVERRAAEEFPSLEQLYRGLHERPELSFQEKESSARVAAELERAGFSVTQGVGGYGVVGVLKNGEGPKVLIRSDLDALPVKEFTGLPYSSKAAARDENGRQVDVMHACGHDVHMTCLVGVARVMAAMRSAWKGTLVLIGQPAEERGAGARKMLDDGLYKRFPRPDYALALHVDSSLQSGKIGYTSGYALANVDTVEITIRGVGGHGAYPEMTKDPIVLSAQVILGLQTIVSREVRAIDPAVITVGSIHGGTKSNIIPNDVKMELTVRSYSDDVRKKLLDGIERVTKGMAKAAGIPDEIEPIVKVLDENTPATYNDPQLVERTVRALEATLGEGNVVAREAMMGGEDFGRYGREEPRVPIFMFRLGSVSSEAIAESAQSGKPLPVLHSSFYKPDVEPTIKTGIRAMAAAAMDLMKP